MPNDTEVHVWVAFLPDAGLVLPKIEKYLSDFEREKAGRFFHHVDRMRYIMAHGILRDLLSRYTKADPAGLKFTTNEFGKPELVSSETQPILRFNLAHSGDVVLFAITKRRRVGIDVEKIRPDVDVMELAASQFAKEEINELRMLSSGERKDAFYLCWTRKEAYIKAIGTGLSLALNRFAVTIRSSQSIKLSWSDGDPAVSRDWAMYDLCLHSEYAAAVVVEAAQPIRVVQRTWDTRER